MKVVERGGGKIAGNPAATSLDGLIVDGVIQSARTAFWSRSRVTRSNTKSAAIKVIKECGNGPSHRSDRFGRHIS